MNIFVGCSSRLGNNKSYIEAAQKLGKFIADNKYNLVFGGSKSGLMGQVYEPISKSSSKIIVTSVEFYKDDLKDIKYQDGTISPNINERKNSILKFSDILIFLPGGLGSIDEIMSSIETKRGGEHNKPIIIININNYYNNLIKVFDKLFKEDFAKPECKSLFTIVNTIEEAEKLIKTFEIKK